MSSLPSSMRPVKLNAVVERKEDGNQESKIPSN